MPTRRPQKTAELLREGVTQIVGYELEDPRVLGVTVVDVRVAPNNRDARVFVLVTGTEQEVRDALAALKHAAPFVRQQLSLLYDLPRVPLLHFVRDTVEERASRVDDLLLSLERDRLTRESADAGVGNAEEGDAPPDALSGHTRFNN